MASLIRSVRGGTLALVLLAAAPGGAQPAETPVAGPVFTPVAPLGGTVTARPGDEARVWSLDDCLTVALEQNDTVRAERLRRGELDGQKYQALSTGLPTVDLAGDWSRGRDPSFALDESFGGAGEGFAPPADAPDWFQDWLGGFGSFIPAPDAIPAQTFYHATATLNWEINPLKIIGAVGAANLGIERQDELIRSVEHQTTEDVIGAYHRILSLAEAVRALEAQYANQAELLSLTRMRFELGFATRLDTLQAAVALANLEPQLRSVRQSVTNAGARLNALMGRTPDAPLTIANDQAPETAPIATEVALELATSRPDLRALELFEGLLERSRQAQQADARPYLSLYGSYGFVGRTTDTLFDDGHDTWRASVAINVPVFNGLLTKGLVDETEAQIRRTQAELAGGRRRIEVEVLEILNNLRTARENLAAARLNLEQAEEALEESLLMYRLGKASYLNALDAEANHLTARRTLIEARYDVLTLTASLKRAIGVSPRTPLAAIPGLVATTR